MNSSRSEAWVLFAALLVIILGLVAWRAPECSQVWTVVRHRPIFGRDVRGAFYVGAAAYRDGKVRIYDESALAAWEQSRGTQHLFSAEYPPLTYLMFVPLAGFSIDVAVQAVFFANLALLVLTVALLCALLARRLGWRAAALMFPPLLAGSLVFSPTMDCLVAGQISILILFLLTLFAMAYTGGKRDLSALPLALAISLKLTPAALLLYLVVRRDWRTLGLTLLWMLGTLVPVVLYLRSPSIIADYIAILPSVARPVIAYTNQSCAGFVGKFMLANDFWSTQTGDPTLARTMVMAAVVVVLGLSVGAVRRQKDNPARVSGELGVFLMAALLCLGRSWPNYHVNLLLAFVLLFLYAADHFDVCHGHILLGLMVLVMLAAIDGEVSTHFEQIQVRVDLLTWHIPFFILLTGWVTAVLALRAGGQDPSPGRGQPGERALTGRSRARLPQRAGSQPVRPNCPSMRIAFDVRPLQQAQAQMRGIGTVVRQSIEALSQIDTDDEFLLMVWGDAALPALDLAPAFVHQWLPVPRAPLRAAGWLYDRWVLPRILHGKADIGHFLNPFDLRAGWPVCPPDGPRVVVTVHDMVPVQHPEIVLKGHLRLAAPAFRLIAAGFRRASALACVSAATAAAVRSCLGEPLPLMRVVPDAVDNAFRPHADHEVAALCARLDLARPYLLYVGGLSPNKNLETLLSALAHLPQVPLLVIATSSDFDASHPVPVQISRLGLESRVRFVRGLSTPDLACLYSGARILVLPSLCEGFGLPPIEAMAAATPVACSDIPALKEVGGDAVRFFNPNDPVNIAGEVAAVWDDTALAAELRQRGLQRAAGMRWSDTARALLGLYRELAATPRPLTPCESPPPQTVTAADPA